MFHNIWWPAFATASPSLRKNSFASISKTYDSPNPQTIQLEDAPVVAWGEPVKAVEVSLEQGVITEPNCALQRADLLPLVATLDSNMAQSAFLLKAVPSSGSARGELASSRAK